MTQIADAPSPETVTDAPIVQIRIGPTGLPVGATGSIRIRAPASRVWTVVSDVDSFSSRVPMISRIKRDGDRVTVQLKFKVSFFSVGFEFVADATRDEGRRLDLRWVSGEPRAIHLGFEIVPVADAGECVLRVDGGFDVQSLGWLAKYFLKNHPEIEFGIYPGVVLVLLDSMNRAALGK